MGIQKTIDSDSPGDKNVKNVPGRNFAHKQPLNFYLFMKNDVQLPGDSVIGPDGRNFGLHRLSHDEMQRVLNEFLSTHAANITERDGITPSSSLDAPNVPIETVSVARDKTRVRGNGRTSRFSTGTRAQGSQVLEPSLRPRRSNSKKNRKL